MTFELLERDWKTHLADSIASAESEIFISSPYITSPGAKFVTDKLPKRVRTHGGISFLTNLSPQNVAQGATDPNALRMLGQAVAHFKLWHLPNLHAKVYVVDDKCALVTSGNLTAGGLKRNYEYGVRITDAATVKAVLSDVTSYAHLGANISDEQLVTYIEIGSQVRASFREAEAKVRRSAHREFTALVQTAKDKLIEAKISEGPIHTVFAKTILYLLRKHKRLTTRETHDLIAEIHPDLCDDSVNRVINGQAFGKKWKHIVRTSQQNLKSAGLIQLQNGYWKLTGMQ